jgi:hypothetical protein
MKLELEVFGALCSTSTFRINDINADSSDFGERRDRSQKTAEDYGCGDMQFTRVEPTPEVLAKYRINEDEYSIIAGQLEDGLSFGRCGWCA